MRPGQPSYCRTAIQASNGHAYDVLLCRRDSVTWSSTEENARGQLGHAGDDGAASSTFETHAIHTTQE